MDVPIAEWDAHTRSCDHTLRPPPPGRPEPSLHDPRGDTETPAMAAQRFVRILQYVRESQHV